LRDVSTVFTTIYTSHPISGYSLAALQLTYTQPEYSKHDQTVIMRVLLLGATGNLGSRLVPALLTHGHNVVAYVRSSSKLESLLPATVYEQITVAQGDATDSQAIKKAIADNKCDSVVTAAGVAAVAPWSHGDLPVIFRAVLTAVCDIGTERTSPLRVWFLGGQSVLNYPGTQSMLSN
jgi:putative NADH-flavin reductase